MSDGQMASSQALPRASSSQGQSNPESAASPDREIAYEHSKALPGLLSHLGASLLVSTYQAGKLAVVGARQDALTLSFHNFERAMGVAARPDRLAVGSRRQVWFLNSAPEIAPRLQPPGAFDHCFLTRTALYTGEIAVHELAFGGADGNELWCANTLFSCLCTLDERFSFVPRWRPKFITTLAAEDRCHLNGFTLGDDHRPAYVTVIAQTDAAHGWREHKVSGGCVIDVKSGEVVLSELSMPHSPRWHAGKLWVLDSGRGRLVLVDAKTGRGQTVAELPGYTRGLAMYGGYAFIGLSRIRESNVFGGLPISERRDELKCGVGVIELATGKLVSHLEFKSGVEEIFAVEVLPRMRSVALSGPYPHLDGSQTIWNAPAMQNC